MTSILVRSDRVSKFSEAIESINEIRRDLVEAECPVTLRLETEIVEGEEIRMVRVDPLENESEETWAELQERILRGTGGESNIDHYMSKILLS